MASGKKIENKNVLGIHGEKCPHCLGGKCECLCTTCRPTNTEEVDFPKDMPKSRKLLRKLRSIHYGGKEMNFIKMTEHNEWEGETWNFWLQLNGNEEAIRKLIKLVKEDGDHTYSFDLESTNEKEIDILVDREDNNSYMALHNKVSGAFNIERLIGEIKDGVSISEDLIYKGQIKNYFKEVKE